MSNRIEIREAESLEDIEELTGEESVECTPGWESRCAEATSKHCNCACGGANHGKVLKAKLAAWKSDA